MMPVRFIVLPHGTGLPLPTYETTGAAGMDVRAALPVNQPLTLAPRGRAAIPTGLIFVIPKGFEGQIRPRSGLALKNGITVLNAPGTIDADYRGEIGVILINHGSEPFIIERGQRIAQLVLSPITQLALEKVDFLDDTERGAGGFGSTGLS